MQMTHPGLPGYPAVDVDETAFNEWWQYVGWVEVVPPPDVEGLTVDEIVARVADDPAAAAAALEAEEQRAKPRTTLTSQLAGIAGTEPTDTPKER
jgi:hypothetical protein